MNANQLEITKKMNAGVLALTIILVSTAVVAIIFSQSILGTLLLLTGIVVFAIKGKQEVYKPTGSKIKRGTYYFDKEIISRVENIVKGGFEEDAAILPLLENGGGKMETIMTTDREFIAVQLFRFVPHKFEETTEHICYTGIKARKLIECIEKSKKMTK
ncbi:MAG: hypothetical protein PHI95_02305 [Bacteroidales bacterium]|nr:hypothetical protein [Bacteroidales bacterium]MDD4292734.1 hypothetical protein [Bacteroidales bacterium]